ncbi:MAG: DUF4391 domain-containing protein [Clostridium sp.]|nr:DUF4391 domain-containing protein [Clostridium sp.]
MFGLPQSTEYGKRIPKQKFYDNLNVSPALKRVFVGQIRVIYWRNKIASSTLNVAAGEDVNELEVFEISLSQKDLDQAVLLQIDREIPYHILFVLSFEEQVQAWIGYKEEASAGGNAFKVSSYYHTEWMPEDKLHLNLEGTSLDAVYENLVRQIAGDDLQGGQAESLKDSVEKDKKRKELEKQIAVLQGKVRKEKQLNRQMELNGEVKRLRIELEELR